MASQVTVLADARGGDGGDGSGTGGTALAYATAVALNGNADADASADGGYAVGDSGPAMAVAVADGLDAYARATATIGSDDEGALILKAKVVAEIAGVGEHEAGALAFYDHYSISAPPPFGVNVGSFLAAAPSQSLVDNFMSTNPTIAGGFADATSYFAILQMNGSHNSEVGGAQTAYTSIDFTVNLGALPAMENLLIGFAGGTASGAGFTQMTFNIRADNNVIETHTWNTVADAVEFFSDQFKDFGCDWRPRLPTTTTRSTSASPSRSSPTPPTAASPPASSSATRRRTAAQPIPREMAHAMAAHTGTEATVHDTAPAHDPVMLPIDALLITTPPTITSWSKAR